MNTNTRTSETWNPQPIPWEDAHTWESHRSIDALVGAYFLEIDWLKSRVEDELIADYIDDREDDPVAFPLTPDGKVWRVLVIPYEDLRLRSDVIEDVTITTLVSPNTDADYHLGTLPVDWRISGTGRLGTYSNIRVWVPDSKNDRFWGKTFETFADVTEAQK